MSSNNEVNKIRLIFMGTPDFALPGFKSLIADNSFEIIGVYTKADKPIGRKQLLTPPPVKVLAEENNIPVFQPEKIKLEIENIKNLKPDLIVVIAYGKIIPQEILDIPKYGCINVHASLLPKYRGAACLNAPILNGDSETGITIMKMEAGLDTGPILRQVKMELMGKESLADVHDYLSNLGAKILPDTIHDWISGKITPQIQDETAASYIKTLDKEDARINWDKPAQEIERMIRAFNPWPGTFCYTKENKILKILEATVSQSGPEDSLPEQKIGQVSIKNGELTVKCEQDNIIILKLQVEGGRAMNIKDFLSGHQDFINQILK